MAGAVVMLAVDGIEELLSSPSAASSSGWSSSIKKQLIRMSPELRSIGAVIDDDECRGVANEYVQQWRADVVDAVYCLKDAMDDIVHLMEAKERCCSYSSKLPRLVARLAHFALLRRARRRIAGEVHQIRHRLRAIYEEMYGLELAVDAAARNNSRGGRPQRLTSALIPAVEPVGREEERARLMELLLLPEGREDDPKTTTVSVVGMGGTGKTTLVQMVFQDKKIRSLFGPRVWVTLTNRFVADDILRAMLKQLGDDDDDGNHDVLGALVRTDSTNHNPHDRLVRRLQDKLQDKTYLVVLDDVWSVDALNQIRAALPLPHLTRSRVVVTSRNKNVAAADGGSHFILEMGALSTDRAWALFCNSAFPDIGECPPELVPIAERIVDECGGLPQALALNGSLLRGRERNVSEWERFLFAAKSEELAGNGMMKVLLLSFYELPSQIKPCLLYLGLFPKGRSLKCSKIARLWRAEGFIQAADNQDPDQVSEHYLSELVQRSLVQTFKVDSSGRMLRFRVHDLMHDAIVSIAQRINFLSLSDQDASLSTLGQPPPRRLATKSMACALGSSSPCMLTLVLSSGANEAAPLFSPFSRLKVLHLKGMQFASFPLEILNLFHLRYLHLRRTNIRELPEDIWKLQNLQTLDLKRSPVAALPKGIVKLRHLRHLLVYEQIFLGVECPAGMDGLTSLEKLSNLNVTRGGGQLEELCRMTQLKRLGITYLRPENGVHLSHSISRMSHLQSLYLYSGDDQQSLKIETLSTASTSLRCINLRGRLTSLPKLGSARASLTKFRLNFSRLLTDPFSCLQHSLHNLVELYLHNDAYLGEELHAQGGGFGMLKKLYVQNLSILKRLVIDRGAMINLEYLELIECKKLERVPRGIERLSHLKEFYLGMVHGSCIDSIRRGTGEDWDKVKHIPVIREIYRERERLYRRPL